MKVKVNQETCIGCGACVAVAEDVFEIQDSGLSHAKKEEVPETIMDDLRKRIAEKELQNNSFLKVPTDVFL